MVDLVFSRPVYLRTQCCLFESKMLHASSGHSAVLCGKKFSCNQQHYVNDWMKPIPVQSGIDFLSHELLSKAIHTCHVRDAFLYTAFVACCQNVVIAWPCPWAWIVVCLINPEVIHSMAWAFVFPRNFAACWHPRLMVMFAVVHYHRERENHKWEKRETHQRAFFPPFFSAKVSRMSERWGRRAWRKEQKG